MLARKQTAPGEKPRVRLDMPESSQCVAQTPLVTPLFGMRDSPTASGAAHALPTVGLFGKVCFAAEPVEVIGRDPV